MNVDPPFQHRHTWNGCLLTGSCCSLGSRGQCRSAVGLGVFEIERRRVFFSGYTFGYGHKTTGATLRTVRQKKLRKKTAKNNTYKSKIRIPTLYKVGNVNISLHCRFRSGAWHPRADVPDCLVRFENAIIYIDTIKWPY